MIHTFSALTYCTLEASCFIEATHVDLLHRRKLRRKAIAAVVLATLFKSSSINVVGKKKYSNHAFIGAGHCGKTALDVSSCLLQYCCIRCNNEGRLF